MRIDRAAPRGADRWTGVARRGCAAAALAITAAACAGGSGGARAAGSSTAVPTGSEGATPAEVTAPATGADAGYPVTVPACEGDPTRFEQAPQRIMTANGSSLELLFWLGVEDRVIGTGFPPTPGSFPEEFAAAAEDVEVLSPTSIPNEVLLGSDADMLLKTFSGGMHADEPTAEQLAEAGVGEVVLRSTGCASSRTEPQDDLSTVMEDIRTVGAAVGEPARADELVRGMQADLDAVDQAIGDVPEDERPTVFLFDYDAGTQTASTTCNQQVAHGVITAAGGRNLFADCDAANTDVGWEQVVERDPDVILVGVRARPSAEELDAAFAEAEEFLRSFPATSTLPAVEQGAMIRTQLEVTTIAGVRNADTVERIAAALYPDRVPAE